MSSQDLKRIGGALSAYWEGGVGPSRSKIQSALMIAGYGGDEGYSKQDLVLKAVANSDDELARKVIEELVGLLRESELLDDVPGNAPRLLRKAFEATDHELTPVGYVIWANDIGDDGPIAASAAPVPAGPAIRPAVPEARESSLPRETASPNLALLVSSLRRLGSGAVRPVIDRRHPQGRAALEMNDEYDLQDIVEVLLRSLYGDVRNEEWTPSSAGSASRIDTFLREGRTALEVKVTRSGRAERHIKAEILTDINDYQGHPGVRTLVVAVFDLVHSFKNIVGFEHDLSGVHGTLDVIVEVIPWVGPLGPRPSTPG